MKDKLAKLIDVKSIVTFGIIGCVIALALTNRIDPKDMVVFGGIILTYFFTREKKNS